MAEAGEHPRQQRRKPRIFRLDSTPAGVVTRAKQTQLSPFLGQKWGLSEKTNPISRRKSSVVMGFLRGARRPGRWGQTCDLKLPPRPFRSDPCRLTGRRMSKSRHVLT